MKKIALIGCTGSIGRQTLSVVRRYRDQFKVVAMVAASSAEELSRRVREFRPEYAALTDEGAAARADICDGVRFLSGEDGGLTALEECGADIAVIACGGFSGLKYSLAAVRCGMALALANKESLVCGGELLTPLARDLRPVDSEHSAIWQALSFDRSAPFNRLIITASGGPFRNRRWEELGEVTPEQALNHPTWRMGRKITVDCATLLNKGFEVIEAHHLYGVPFSKIEAVIHPQSIVHSMVELCDGAVMAQASYPTMELPIQLALTYPERMDCGLKPLDFTVSSTLSFEPLVKGRYPMYDLALECGRAGGVLPTALNAASEVAVNAFLQGTISFTDIYTVTDKVVQSTAGGGAEDYGTLAETDVASRIRAASVIDGVK